MSFVSSCTCCCWSPPPPKTVTRLQLQSAKWKEIGESDWISRLSNRCSYKHEVRVVCLSNQSPKELEKACTESVKEVEEVSTFFGFAFAFDSFFAIIQNLFFTQVVMYGNYALVYFKTEELASDIRKKGLKLKVCFQLNAESTLFSRSINFIPIIYIVPKKRV